MNRFVEHHRKSIRFSYSCFDRIICNGCMQQFQHSKRSGSIVWFLRTQRQAPPLTRAYFAKLSRDYHVWLTHHAQEKGIDIVEPPADIRREDWVEPYYQQLGKRQGIAVILKAREPERIAVHFAKSNDITVERRYVNLYYFYLHDEHYGRMFLRLCPYFPFNIRLWLNGHNWLACRLHQEGIAFSKLDNLFTACANPQRLQELSDAFMPADILKSLEAWVPQLLPFFSDSERQQGYRHQLYMAQMEYCHNIIFHQRAAADRLFERLMDNSRGLGHPDKLAIVFGRSHFQPDMRTGEILLKITKQRTPVLCSRYKSTSIKQYVRNGGALRTESTTYQVNDLAINKNINNLPRLREALATANHRFLEVQQDVLASYVDRGQLQELRKPSISVTGRRVPGLRLDDPRLLAVFEAITCFAYLVGKGCFRTKDLLVDVQKALGNPQFNLSQLRYDLSKLRGKGLLVHLPRTHTYQLTPQGYRIAILYLKLYQRIYAPLTAGIRDPIATDNEVLSSRQTKLDRLYLALDQAITKLTSHLRMAA
jgi:hypothetical protein